MYAKQLGTLLEFMFRENLSVLIVGQPGTGKSEIVDQVAIKLQQEWENLHDNQGKIIKGIAKEKGWDLIISHPVVSDPTDYKGLPFAIDGKATFLPFNDLERLLNTTVPLIYFLDDFGQASPSVQSACMQLILAGQINGHVIRKDLVRFVAATNRRSDRSNVSGILEAVKSRFASIVELEPYVPDWVEWAWEHGMPHRLISFIQFRPELLNQFVPSRDMVNSPMPRTVYNVGKMINAGIPAKMDFEVIKGAAGEGFASEYLTFDKTYMQLPTVSEIVSNPSGAKLPDSISARYAITGALTNSLDKNTIAPILIYLKRLGNELTVATLKNAAIRKPEITTNSTFIQWASQNFDMLM